MIGREAWPQDLPLTAIMPRNRLSTLNIERPVEFARCSRSVTGLTCHVAVVWKEPTLYSSFSLLRRGESPAQSLYMPKQRSIATESKSRLTGLLSALSLFGKKAACSSHSTSSSTSPSRKVVHDANNQLSIILGHADMLAHDLGAESEHQRHVRAIIRASRELARLLQK
jgi:hypothetical protein